jgi:hypothetical protein
MVEARSWREADSKAKRAYGERARRWNETIAVSVERYEPTSWEVLLLDME